MVLASDPRVTLAPHTLDAYATAATQLTHLVRAASSFDQKYDIKELEFAPRQSFAE
jgi:hypothetical protein